MNEETIKDMEERLLTLQGGFAALYAVCAALAETHPSKETALKALLQAKEGLSVHYLNETFPESVHQTIEHYLDDFEAILSRKSET